MAKLRMTGFLLVLGLVLVVSIASAEVPGWFYGYTVNGTDLTWLGVNLQASPGYDFGIKSYTTVFSYQFVNYEDFLYGRIGVSTKDMFATDCRVALVSGANLINLDDFTYNHWKFKVFSGFFTGVKDWMVKNINSDINIMFFVTYSPEKLDNRTFTAGMNTDAVNAIWKK